MIKSSLVFVNLLAISVLLLCSCDGDGKVIEAKGSDTSRTGIFTSAIPPSFSNDESSKTESFKVRVIEVLQTSKYSYLKVEGEGDGLSVGEPYWIATLKNDFIEGEDYVYRGRLFKTDFESKEFNRIFDEIYLVSFVDRLNEISRTELSVVAIADLVSNQVAFTGKSVKVFGQVVKVNDGIMDRNWIHLVDGSADDYDFVITTKATVSVGQTVTFEGLITTNKDFGAGYKYDLLMEDAVTIK